MSKLIRQGRRLGVGNYHRNGSVSWTKYPYRHQVRDLNKIWVWLGKVCMHAYLTDGTNCWDISCPSKTTSEVEMHSDDLFMFCGESTKEERIKRLVSESDACLTGIKSAIRWIRKQYK